MQITQVDILNSDSDSDSGSDLPEIAAKTSTMLATSSSTYSSGTCIFFFHDTICNNAIFSDSSGT